MTMYRYNNPIEIEINENRKVIYMISKKHRDESPQKSKWIIPINIEINLFEQAIRLGNEKNYTAWNLFKCNNAISVIGISQDGQELKLAKFVDGNKNDRWHGYPANYLRNNQDIPPSNVLDLWVNNKFITPATMAKIRRGQRCNL